MNLLKCVCVPGLVAAGNVQAATLPANKTDERPNVLIILVDDAGYNDFGFMGSKELKTPNIDALCRDGVRFSDAHVAATVSSPSRACLITGRYGHRFGYECNLDGRGNGLPLSERTIGDVFKANGYATAAIGKWHLGAEPAQHPNRRGFDLFFGMKAGGRDYFYDETKSDRPGSDGNLLLNDRQVKFDGYLTDVFTDKAVEFVRASQKPFMLYLAYNAVHTPMQALQSDLDRFKGHPRRKLAAMTWALDRGIGRVVEALKASGKYENTLIFFLSDNGGATINTSSNYPLKGFKGNKFEGGHRVPFFVVWKGKLPSGGSFDGLSSSLDIFATAADGAGITSTPKPLDGVSLLPFLKGRKKGNPHKTLYWRKMDSRAVRSGDYKLIVTRGVDSVLYNLRKDPEEMDNLIRTEPKTYRKLAAELDKWERQECVSPLWIETGWGNITNGIHRRLMNNEVKTAKDLHKKK